MNYISPLIFIGLIHSEKGWISFPYGVILFHHWRWGMKFHIDLLFRGRVKGVGFCYQTFQIAKEFEVSGYVANLSDGSVRLEAEGEQDEVEAFKREIENQMQVFIKGVEAHTRMSLGLFEGFTIR